MPKNKLSTITEDDVVNHVEKYGRYDPRMGKKTPYVVSWRARSYVAGDTRDLVLQICKDEGIPAV